MKTATIKTTEKYGVKKNLLGKDKHTLTLITNEVLEDGTLKQIDSVTIDLPDNIPTWLTEHDLWNHTDYQLQELRKLMEAKDEKRPSKETLNIWREWLNRD